MKKDLDDLLIGSVDKKFKDSVMEVAQWLVPKDPKDGLGIGDKLAYMLLEKDSFSKDEINLLALLVSGNLYNYTKGRKPKQLHTTGEKIEIYSQVRKYMDEGKKWEEAIQLVSKRMGIRASIKTIERYYTEIKKRNLNKV